MKKLDNILKNLAQIKLYKFVLLNSLIKLENFQIKVPKNHLKTNNMNNLDNTTFMQETTSSTHLLLN